MQPLQPSEPDRQRILALYDRGLILQAHLLAQSLAPYDAWTGTPARVLAGRLHNQLGAPTRGSRFLRRAWRDDPADPEARYFGASLMLHERGPLFTWRRLEAEGPLPESASSDLRGS